MKNVDSDSREVLSEVDGRRVVKLVAAVDLILTLASVLHRNNEYLMYNVSLSLTWRTDSDNSPQKVRQM